MTITANDIINQVIAAVAPYEKLTAKQRNEFPPKAVAENYNNLLELSKEAMPNVDSRRWPLIADVTKPAMGVAHSAARYVDIISYLKQIIAILAEEEEPLGGFRR